MIVELYSIKDELSEFAPPVPMKDEENAKRYLRYKCTTDEFMKMAPKDFSIWKVGIMNTETGKISAWEPVLVERGAEYGD